MKLNLLVKNLMTVCIFVKKKENLTLAS